MTDQVEEIQEPRGVAYSYVRFSTAKQELGDSLRRQVEACEKYCREHNLDLHPVSYRDLGVSAFKKKNIESGALAAFIDAVKTGKVAKGFLLVKEPASVFREPADGPEIRDGDFLCDCCQKWS